ncbi:MAG: hypothetical protein IT424_12510 [Pirellulales bacterium]|nr:hypothetical protein [Pirellulales bacterium]
MFRFTLIAVLGLIALAQSPATAAQYDWVAGIDYLHNPSVDGLWSYGETETLGSEFMPFRRSYARTRLGELQAIQWVSHVSAANIWVNPTDELLAGGGEGRLPMSMVMHPGSGDQYAVLRFTAPTAGNYDFNVSFTGNNETGTTTDVHVLVNDVAVSSGNVNSAWFDTEPGEGPTLANTEPIQLAAGDTIDIAVGPGGNGYAYDLTGISGWIASSATSAVVPEPSSTMLIACGIAMLTHYRRRLRERAGVHRSAA